LVLALMLTEPRDPSPTHPMIAGVLFALLAALVYGFLGVTFEAAAKRHYAPWNFIFWKQLSGTIMIFAVVVARGAPLYRPDILGLAAVGALSYVLTCFCYLTASRERDISANWTKVLGSLLTLAAIVLIGGKTKLAGLNRASKWATFILGAFLLNGVLSTLFRWIPDGFSFLFAAYFYVISCLMSLPFKLRHKQAPSPTKGLAGWSATGAFCHCAGMLLTIAALSAVAKVSRQAGVIVYPITNGFVIPLGVILGAIILRQTIEPRNKLGVLLGMAGVALLSLP